MERELKGKIKINEGLLDGFPIIIGYLPVAMAFGIVSKTTGLSAMESTLFSVMVYAGASQFMALSLLSLGVSIEQIILSTLLVNSRHLLMSASLATRLNKSFKKYIPLVALGVTDEVFSVISFKKGELTKEYVIPLQMVAYLSWILGTTGGYYVGEILPAIIKSSMGVSLYAMFAAILIPEAKKSRKVLLTAIAAGGVNTILNMVKIIPQGWNLIVSIVVVALGASLLVKEEVEENE